MAGDEVIYVWDAWAEKFLNKDGAWVESFDEALKFATAVDAFIFCMEKCIHHAEIILRAGSPQCDLTIPVR